MNILLIHNKYSIYGGEDKIVEQQYNILKKNNNVKVYYRDNNEIRNFSFLSKIKLFREAYNSKKTISDLLELIEKFRPDLVHVHNIYPLISPSIYNFFYERNIPVVQTLHNYRFICPNGLMFRDGHICDDCLRLSNFRSCIINKCYRESFIQSLWYSDIISKANKNKCFDKISKFVALNDFVKDKMIEKGYKKDLFEIIPNCIDISYNNCLNKKEDYYIYVGRLSSEKGILTMMKAFSKLSNVNLKIVGDGPLKNELKKFIFENNCNNIDLLGFKSGNEKLELIANAKALIVPSEWYENFPTVVLEAFSLGTIVIGTSTGGLSYMIKHNYNGYKFNLGDQEGLIEAIKNLNLDERNIIKLSNNAYNTYINYYSKDIYYNKHIELYNKILAKGE